MNLEEANIEIHDYFEGEPPKDASLIGLVLVAREIGEQIEDATRALGEELVKVNESLATIARALEALARRAQ